MANHKLRFAFDRSVRTIDVDGHMHVASSVISAAAVNGYRAEEIPNADELGLTPGRVYMLFRDPAELAKAAPTFANKPLVSEHKPQTAADHDHEIVVGSVANPVWDAATQRLKAGLVIWARDAIEGVDDGSFRDLSCGYRYKAVMQPGSYQGIHYDGRMVDIVGNHVALVAKGRVAGAFVGDSQMRGKAMTIRVATPEQKVASTTLRALLSNPKQVRLGQDVDLTALLALLDKLDGSEGAGLAMEPDDAALGIDAPKDDDDADPAAAPAADPAADPGAPPEDPGATPPPAAADPAVDPAGTPPPADPGAPDPDAPPVADPAAMADPAATGGDPVDKVLALLKTLLQPEDVAVIAHMLKPATPAPAPAAAAPPKVAGSDAPMPTAGTAAITKAGMDAALKAVAKSTEERTIARLRSIYEAEAYVKPWVGQLAIAQDSAEAVYKLALDTLGYELPADVPAQAYKHILAAQPKPGDRARPTTRQAMDAAATTSYETMFPNANRLLNI